jgi:hypothetical protein
MSDQVISRIGEIFDIGLWLEWFTQLDRTFIFLLALPFVVAVVGLWAAYRDRDLEQEDGLPQKRAERAERDRRTWRKPALPE